MSNALFILALFLFGKLYHDNSLLRSRTAPIFFLKCKRKKSCNQKTVFPEVYGIEYTQIQFQKVEAVRLCLRASKPPEVVIPFIIRDDGIGIPEEHIPYLTDPFYRVDKARSRESGGTGLGLAITRNIILLHHGAIRLKSEEGTGTTFTVRIPLNYIDMSAQ